MFAVLLATVGITISSISWGALSAVYYGVAATSGALAFFTIIKSRSNDPNTLFFFLLIILEFLILWLLQFTLLVHDKYEYTLDGAFLAYAGIISVITLIFSCSTLDQVQFARLCGQICMLHLAIIIVGGILLGGVHSESFGARFHAWGIGSAAWAEIGLGTIVAGILSRSKWLLLISTGFGGYLIVETEMRTAGIAALSALLLLLSAGYSSRRYLFASLLFVFCLGATVTPILGVAWMSELLLLDDPYRGLETGFSGRTDSITAGVALINESPFFGVGPEYSIGRAVHNGYVKYAAQFGIPAGLIFVSTLIWSIKISVSKSDVYALAAITALMIYYLAQPRHINFQLMPLISLLAIGQVVVRKRKRSNHLKQPLSIKSAVPV